MRRIIIADTSCFIVLTKIDALDILFKVYGTVITTSDVADEYGLKLPKWVKIEKVRDLQRQNLLERQVGKGESSTLASALQSLMIIRQGN